MTHQFVMLQIWWICPERLVKVIVIAIVYVIVTVHVIATDYVITVQVIIAFTSK